MRVNTFGDSDKIFKYDKDINIIKDETMKSILHANGIMTKRSTEWYSGFERFGGIDPYVTPVTTKEYVFFTKPDLYIFDNTGSYESLTLREELQDYPIFVDAFERYKPVLTQLQVSAPDPSNAKNPFCCLLTNTCNSALELPSISANVNDSSANIYGSSIQYRSHSLKSDNGFDFSVGFTDTRYLEVYMFAKLYDVYMTLVKVGKVKPKRQHILDMVLFDKFSAYKIVVSDDGETIMHFGKVTGINLLDVPRSDLNDFPSEYIKYSLSFHGDSPDDSNPIILNDFNSISPGDYVITESLYNNNAGRINNNWVKYPVIIQDYSQKRSDLGLGGKIYKLKWSNKRKGESYNE